MSGDELHDLIRQLRVELEWAARTGWRPPPPPAPPPLRASTAPATVEDRPQPEPRHPDPPPASSPTDKEGHRRPPEAEGGPSGGGARPPGRPPLRRDAHPHRPWEAYLPGDGPQEPGARAERSAPSHSAGGGPAAPRPPPAPPSAADSGAEPGASDPREGLAAAQTVDDVRDVLGPCVRCKLHRLGRKKIVFGVGPADAEVMFVGEGPGGDEDRVGEPFVGAAGQLLTRIIEGGMGMKRGEVYIANIVKCRPPRNRNPEPDEVERCEPFLKAQIRVIQPRVLVALGKYAAQTLLRDTTPITRLRGRWREYEGIPLMPTFHPAYLLRNPAEKRPVWEDIQSVLKFLGRPVPSRG